MVVPVPAGALTTSACDTGTPTLGHALTIVGVFAWQPLSATAATDPPVDTVADYRVNLMSHCSVSHYPRLKRTSACHRHNYFSITEYT